MKYFNSNETLEMCDVRISDNGKMEIMPKSYHSEALARLGKPEKTIRGRVKMVDGVFNFEPYAEGTNKLTFSRRAVVGSTTVAVTADKVKFSLTLSRNYTMEQLVTLIETEMQEVVRRMREDLYSSLIK